MSRALRAVARVWFVLAVCAAALAVSVGTGEAQGAPALHVRRVPLPANYVAYDPVQRRLYATVGGSVPGIGNSVTDVDPFAVAVGWSVWVGSNPVRVAVSDDGRYVYASLHGIGAIRRVDTAARAADLQWWTGDPRSTLLWVEDMHVLPGRPGSVVVARAHSGFPRHAGVVVYDDGVARPNTTPGHTGPGSLALAPDGATVYGVDTESTSRPTLFTMRIDANGITRTDEAVGLLAHSGIEAELAGGLLYLRSGEVVDPGSRAVVGRLAAYPGQTMEVDTRSGRVYALNRGHPSEPAYLRAFDMRTFQLLWQVEVPGVVGEPRGLVKWGDDGLAFVDYQQIVLLRLGDGGASWPNPVLSPPPVPAPPPLALLQLDLAANDLAWDAGRGHLYASVASNAPALANHLAALEPASGAVAWSVPVGAGPYKLAPSGDGRFLYVGLNGAGKVRRVDLASRTPGLEFGLGSDPYYGAFGAGDMAVVPGDPSTVVVSRVKFGYSPSYEGVVAYREGQPLPNWIDGHTGTTRLTFGPDAQSLYGYEDESSTHGFKTMAVDASGVTVTRALYGLTYGFHHAITHAADGRVYVGNGDILDPAAGWRVGRLASSGLVAPDPQNGRAYVLALGRTAHELRAFDTRTFLPLWTAEIPGVPGGVRSLVRWGTNGLAFRTTEGKTYLVRIGGPAYAPSFASTATPSPATIGPNRPVQITAGVTGKTNTTARVDVEVYDPSGRRVFAQGFADQQFQPGIRRDFRATWNVAPAPSSPAGSYRVQVVVSGADGVRHHTNPEAARVTVVEPPAPPTNVSARARDYYVRLEWTLSTSPGVTTYRVYRGTTAGGPKVLIGDSAGTGYTDNGVFSGLVRRQTYYYHVTANTPIAEGLPSAEVSARVR